MLGQMTGRLRGGLTGVALGALACLAPVAGSGAPVTQETLLDPAPQDWLQWRRTFDGWAHSPLDQITKENVGSLTLAWGWAMLPGSQEVVPIVHDGVMYIANPGGSVQALDAKTGDLIWEYRHETPEGFREGMMNRGLALWGDNVFIATPDAEMIALDTKSGQIVWQTTIASREVGKSITAAPIAVDGKVIVGVQGCFRFYEEKCAVVAFDAQTGAQAWRTDTVQREEGDGENTWGGQPWLLRGGGDVWTTATYDPDLDLIYIGVSQAKPWSRLSRGQDGDSLYTSSTLALDPKDGSIQWYRQYIPGETNDMDEAFEHILVDIDGEPSYVNMGKLAILWRGSRVDGTPLPAFDMGLQDQIDLNADGTFATYRDGKIGELGVPVMLCPSTTGFRAWRSMAFNPDTRAVYVPMSINCDEAVVYGEVEMVEGGGGNGKFAENRIAHPDDPDHLGRIAALNIDTGALLWEKRLRTPANTGMLSTDTGLIFAGDWDRNFWALDAQTGAELWRTRLPQAAQGMPITYEVDGVQYIAIPVGTGGYSWSTSVPTQLAPEVKRPEGGNAMMVFALPAQPS
ncbi:Quinohemoprotein alcohol dehydrogenase ADH IIB precursor [Aquimixticola soesokkakensis]|uniref:Quinohemoprotein alcohol dehydrogenase ADH IIB n=1 Tax=Aquimixticola soesokkakensis TaxID=1519096 RepID=A0A1Y5TGS5_9RHOB|nr:PQQ-binding-like beta-propeller repeat protein [Aquimixticola soesokkakensis]SLN63841.1 Quinohemoprotein alcohol dehydrogenase ADH IIB precursor [Aquimixticola soesokkakensis]